MRRLLQMILCSALATGCSGEESCSQCDPDTICRAGLCVRVCVLSSDCPRSVESCVDGGCQEVSDPDCRSDAECACALGGECVGGGCQCQRLADGADCSAHTSAECASGYCDGSRCCTGGDCCSSATDCPAVYSRPAECSDTTPQTSCQGQRLEADCVANVCTIQTADDDSGCSGSARSCPNNLRPVSCTAAADQPIATCPSTCMTSNDCDPGHICSVGLACVHAGRPGEPCGAGGSCDPMLSCQSGRCCDAACEGLCSECDGGGLCTITPPDDPGCGTIDCSGLDGEVGGECRQYDALTGDRCAGLGVCKTADSTTCTSFSVSACASNLIWFDFDEGAGTGTVTNRGSLGAGTNHAATFSQQGQPGMVNGAIELNSPSHGVTIPDQAVLDGLNAWTVEGWFYLDQLPLNGYATLAKKDLGYLCRLVENASATDDYFVGAAVWNPGVGSLGWTVVPPPAVQTWYHLACTWDGSARELRIYWDGELRATSAALGANPATQDTADDFLVGRGLSGENLVGRIDNFKLWSETRTPPQICESAGRTYTGMSCN